MKRLVFMLLAVGGLAWAQTDAPPELEHPTAPDQLPPVNAPKPRLRGTLTVVFSGESAFRPRQLREGIIRQIQTIEEYGLDAANAYDAVFFLESFYRKHGYSQATATSQIVGPWELHLNIEEGPRAFVGSVTIEGNHEFDAATLDDYLLGPIRERFPRIRRDTLLPFVEADIYSGTDLVRRLYAAQGYLDAEVEAPEITLNEEGTSAAILLHIKEGTQFRFSDIRLEGETAFTRDELMKEIYEQTNGIYTDGRLAAAQRGLEDFLQKHGYFLAVVTADADPTTAIDGKVPATFKIEAGAQFRFDGATVSGHSGVKPSFIQKRLRKLNGKIYNPALIDRSFRELIQTGLFRNLQINPEAIPGDQVRLDVSVEEAKPKEFGLGLGYASFFGGIISGSYRDLNFFGSGRPFSINLEVNQRGFGGEILYVDPWLFDSDYQLRLRLYAQTATLKGYSKNEVGFQPSLVRYLTEHWKVSAFVTAEATAIYNVDIEPLSLVGQESYATLSFGVSQTLDYRNNPALPTRGFIFSTSLEVAPNGLGDIAYVRALGSFSYYLPITAKSTLALGARAGLISSLNEAGIPIDERFFNGGATTVRSFSELTLGPRDHAGYPLGGQGYTVFNAEYTFPLIGDLYGAVFVDAGNVVSEARDFGFEDMRYAVGAGVRYNLPIGAIRFDYGLNPSPQQGDAQGAFHFAIGVAF